MIDGLVMVWVVTRATNLLLMPDGRSRLAWRTNEEAISAWVNRNRATN